VVASPTGSQVQFLSLDGSWKPVVYRHETIHVHSGKDVTFDVALTQHGGNPTPVITALYPTGAAGADKRSIALRWTIYDPANVTDPFFAINSATDGTSLVAAFSTWGGPSQNLVYADDQGHIGYHALGRIPIRGSIAAPTPLSFVPVGGIDPTYDWAGYIPYDQLPQIVDPPSGVIATANARITPDNYPYPIALDWEAPYRNECIWKVLLTSKNFTPADSLHLQGDIYSEVDRTVAHRLAYAIDHSDAVKSGKGTDSKRLQFAANILRNWDGSVDASNPAPAIVDATRLALWPMILSPKLGNLWELYTWGEKTYAEEQIIMHAPARWLPKQFTSWDNFLAAAVERGLAENHAPGNLAKWTYGSIHTIDIKHPLFGLSPIITAIIGLPTGTGIHPLSGDGTTVRQSRNGLGPSERFDADLGDLDQSTLNILLGQSENPASPWFLDQWPAWYHATTFPLNWSPTAVQKATTHTLTLNPK
jgi:penicillin amidase